MSRSKSLCRNVGAFFIELLVLVLASLINGVGEWQPAVYH